jgi:hypothetical protein
VEKRTESIVLNEETIQQLASNSLIGMLYQLGHTQLPERIELVFPQTSMGWREKNKGPREYLLYEYNIPYLIESILFLIRGGVEVVTKVVEET